MSATTLLVLGCVRIFQPAHGYLIRRELLSWGVDSWGNVNPGSIYNGLRSGVRAGHLVESATEQGAGPARTTYRLTGDGESAFGGMLRTTLWEPDPMDPARLMAALCFAGMLSRSEMRAAMCGRLLRLQALVAETAHRGAYLARERLAPSWTAEQFHLATRRCVARSSGAAASSNGWTQVRTAWPAGYKCPMPKAGGPPGLAGRQTNQD